MLSFSFSIAILVLIRVLKIVAFKFILKMDNENY